MGSVQAAYISFPMHDIVSYIAIAVQYIENVAGG
jgi:hypothetical protein